MNKLNVTVIYTGEDFRMQYMGTNGCLQNMALDAETKDDAIFEAAHYHGIPESEVAYED